MKIFLCLLFISSFIFIVPAKAARPTFDVTFNLGPSLSQSGNIDDLGDPNLSTGFGFNYYFRLNHGIGIGYNNESNFEGSSEFRQLKDASITTFDLHYAYRYIQKKMQIVFEPGIGTQTLYDEATDYYWGYVYHDDLSTALVLNYKLFIRYILTEGGGTSEEELKGNFFVGAGIINNFSLNDDFNGKDISGSRLAALFQLGIGF